MNAKNHTILISSDRQLQETLRKSDFNNFMKADIYLENMSKMFGKDKFDDAINNLIKHYT